MPPNREPTDTCPICQETALRRVRCSHPSCAFAVLTCPRCDRAQAVAAYVADHEKDCTHAPATPPVVRSTFAAPSRAA